MARVGGGRIWGLAAATAGLTAAAVLVPHADFHYGQAAQQVALETTACLVTLLAAFLVFGRLQRNSRYNELVLFAALSVIALSNLLFVMLPMFIGTTDSSFAPVAALTGRTSGSVLFALAAFVPRTRLRDARGAQAVAALGVLGVLVVSLVLAFAFSPDLPRAVITGSAGLHRYAVMGGYPVVTAIHALQAALAAAAAFGYLRRSAQPGNEFCAWLAVAAMFAAAAHLSYAVDPAIDSNRMSLGDIFRFCFYVVLLVASAREIRSYWRTLASALVAGERRRIARDLHDGLSQELAYLTRNLTGIEDAARQGATEADHEAVRDLLASVERARETSRQAIAQVAAPASASVADALTQAVGPVAKRFGLNLDLDLAAGIGLAPARTSALVGIACEALVNVAKHSGSRQVSLILSHEDGRVSMRVRDAGRGFDTSAFRAGFGLTSMHERAFAVGGELHVSSEPGLGSMVEATL
jgi:signal transduction histidine kinase